MKNATLLKRSGVFLLIGFNYLYFCRIIHCQSPAEDRKQQSQRRKKRFFKTIGGKKIANSIEKEKPAHRPEYYF